MTKKELLHLMNHLKDDDEILIVEPSGEFALRPFRSKHEEYDEYNIIGSDYMEDGKSSSLLLIVDTSEFEFIE